MVLQKYTTTITHIETLNDHVKLFKLQFPEGKQFHFIAGQFVILNMIDFEKKQQRRSYSIASSPIHSDYIELCVKILPDGKVSSCLDTLPVGSHVELDGPYGKFVVDKEQDKELIFIGTGVGIAPLRGMLFDLFEKGHKAPVWLFFGFRYENDFLFKEELSALEEQYHNFHFLPVLSRPGETAAPDLDTGHVTGIIPLYIKNPANKIAFICGSLPMVKDVVVCLEGIGMTKEQIKTDAWG